MQLYSMMQMMRQRQGGMFGQPPQMQPGGGQSPGIAPPPAGTPPITQPPADPSQDPHQQHHGGLHGILPYLGFGLLGGSLLGGNMGQMAPLFGLGGMAAKKFGLFK